MTLSAGTNQPSSADRPLIIGLKAVEVEPGLVSLKWDVDADGLVAFYTVQRTKIGNGTSTVFNTRRYVVF